MPNLNDEVSCVLDTPKQPWISSPYSLISWWDMEHFSARAFFWAGVTLQTIEDDCVSESMIVDPNEPIYNMAASVNPRLREKALQGLKLVQGECARIGLDITAETAKEVQDRLRVEAPLVNFQWLLDQTRGLRKLFEKEARGRIFLYIPKEHSKYFLRRDEPFAFGKMVAESFPSSAFDVHEASICLGCSRSTASVFHLMRIMEVALGVLGRKFGVSLAHTNWAPAIEEIESKIRGMRKDPAWKALPDCNEQQEYYAQAASHFGVLKDAWRNYTMHGACPAVS